MGQIRIVSLFFKLFECLSSFKKGGGPYFFSKRDYLMPVDWKWLINAPFFLISKYCICCFLRV